MNHQRKLTVSKSEWMTTAVEILPDGSALAQPIDPHRLADYLGNRWKFIRQEIKTGRTVQVYERRAR